MPRKQKGVNPLIATILLLLVVMAIGGIIWSWLSGYALTQRTATEEQQKKQAACAGASFIIDLTDVKPNFNGTKTRVVIVNKGDRDLNFFKVYSYYTDGTSDLNITQDMEVEEGGTAVLWTKGDTAEKPKRVIVESVDCQGLTAEVSKENITTG